VSLRAYSPSQRPSFEHADLTVYTPLSPSNTFHRFTLFDVLYAF